jgi:hypothetical protein
MLDEMNIVLDTDPSEVTEGGASQAAMGMGATAPFSDTEPPATAMDEEEDEIEDGD